MRNFKDLEELHPVLVRPLTDDNYDPGLLTDYSFSHLASAPQERRLYRAHHQQIEWSVWDDFFPFLGEAVHAFLEDFAGPDDIVEERMFVEVAGRLLSGKPDLQRLLDDGTYEIIDYKVTSSYRAREPSDQWKTQANFYRYCAERQGRPVSKLTVITFVRDWSRNRAAQFPDYPQRPILCHDIPLMSLEAVENWLEFRIDLHEEWGDDLECSDEERWFDPDAERWAVMRMWAVKATRLFASEEDAKTDAFARGDNYHVEHRPAQPKKCMNYCSVADFCPQFSQWKQGQE